MANTLITLQWSTLLRDVVAQITAICLLTKKRPVAASTQFVGMPPYRSFSKSHVRVKEDQSSLVADTRSPISARNET